jgi:hypothetical protein
MKLIAVLSIAAFAIACGGSESHNSSQAGASAHAGIANPGYQPAVTLSGCLQNADRPDSDAPQPTGSSGRGSAGKAVDEMAAGRGSPGERFTLTDATSASADSDPAAASYILDGNMEALRAHVDKQVRLTGTLDAAAANTAGPQRVRVQSVERVADNCTRRDRTGSR